MYNQSKVTKESLKDNGFDKESKTLEICICCIRFERWSAQYCSSLRVGVTRALKLNRCNKLLEMSKFCLNVIVQFCTQSRRIRLVSILLKKGEKWHFRALCFIPEHVKNQNQHVRLVWARACKLNNVRDEENKCGYYVSETTWKLSWQIA